MKTHKMPAEPDEDVKLLVPGASPSLFFRGGSYSEWTNGEEEYEWHELLQEYDEVHELDTPTEAAAFFRKYGCDFVRLYREAPANAAEKHLKELVEFVEAFA